MRPYSQDLRERIVDTVQRGGGTIRQIAERSLVSVSFVTRLLPLPRSRGSVETRPHGGGNPAVLTPADLERLRALIRERPDATPRECATHLGPSCGLMTVSRALKKLGLPRKKKVPRAAEQDSPEVQEKRRGLCEGLAGIDPRRSVFVDECGANTAMTRTYGRAPAGQRADSHAPAPWDAITLTCGGRLAGVTATSASPGATDTGTFETYVEEVLVPELKPGDVVVWDDLKPHQSEEAIEAVEEAGAEVVPLPPYSPDYTPIEEMFSKVKTYLRRVGARTQGTLYDAVGQALRRVTDRDIIGWFHHAGLCATHG
jgi:transposase